MTCAGEKYPVRQMLAAAESGIVLLTGAWRDTGGTMSQTLAPADVFHYYQRLADLSTLPFWQRAEITDPEGPERGHV